ncbi:hypothetical protein FRC02_011341 [Tulasnella sp. 418]|nr:hypothetical protein FRC02_011341 [Tulasnella sp. 418]
MCLVCPGKFGGTNLSTTPLIIKTCHMKQHCDTLKHKRALAALMQGGEPNFRVLSSGEVVAGGSLPPQDDVPRQPEDSLSGLTRTEAPLIEMSQDNSEEAAYVEDEGPSFGFQDDSVITNYLSPQHSIDLHDVEIGADTQSHLDLDSEPTENHSRETDLFQEYLESLERGETPRTCLVEPGPDEIDVSGPSEENEESDDNKSDCAGEDEFINTVLNQRSSRSGPFSVDPKCPTYPWPSSAMFLTDLLFNSPRLRFSEAQKRAILSWAKQLHAKDVPTLGAVKQFQEHLRKTVGSPMEKSVSNDGDIFYLNDIGKAIAKDYANPIARAAMQHYPEYCGGKMSQVFNGTKMLVDLPDDLLTPTARANGRIFWVNELLQCQSGRFFIPTRYILHSKSPDDQDKQLVALGHDVDQTEAGFSVREEQTFTPVSMFSRTYDEIRNDGKEWGKGFQASSESYAKKMPHSFRKVAGDRMVYSVPLIIFMDDVSGNVSKQWNKHHAVYVSNANLPREVFEKEFFIRFVTSSPHAPPMELMRGVQKSIDKALAEGVLAYDCKHDEEVYLRLYDLFFPGDNPMQAEECSHAGLNCNHFCRTCDVGGTKQHKQSDAGYGQLFKPGKMRTPDQTAATIAEQISLSKQSGATDKIKKSVTATGISDATIAPILESVTSLGKALRRRGPDKQSSVTNAQEAEELLQKELDKRKTSEAINPLLNAPGVDIHRDTPTEILHTVLLGVVKYFWGQTVWLLKKEKKESLFHTRLASIDTDGLNIPKIPADYICKYSGSLIGKHFKSLAQVMPFLIYDLVPKSVLDAWTIIGRLVVLLWHTSIGDTEKYLNELSTTIQDFMHISACCAPTILITKPKFHFLVHLPEYIRRFGPAIAFSTERYESFNSVFRLTCIHGNRQAPSRDTCMTFAMYDIIKHVATGGFWFDQNTGQWVQAANEIVGYVQDHPEHSRLLGLPSVNRKTPGTARLALTSLNESGKRQRVPPVHWSKTLYAQSRGDSSTSQGGTSSSAIPTNLNIQNVTGNGSMFHKAHSFIAKEGDTVVVGSHVIYRRAAQVRYDIGCVLEILSSADVPHKALHITIQRFTFLRERHPILDLPRLDRTDNRDVTSPNDIVCAVNLQHDCISSGCSGFRQQYIRQERCLTDKTSSVVAHTASNHYILNTGSLHNYSFIQSVLPDDLPGPIFSRIPEDSFHEVRTKAAHQVRQRYQTSDACEQELSNDSTTLGHHLTGGEALPDDQAPVFERTSRSKGRGKGKGKQTVREKEKQQRNKDLTKSSIEKGKEVECIPSTSAVSVCGDRNVDQPLPPQASHPITTPASQTPSTATPALPNTSVSQPSSAAYYYYAPPAQVAWSHYYPAQYVAQINPYPPLHPGHQPYYHQGSEHYRR